MRVLPYEFQPLMEGMVVITAELTLRGGKGEIYLCDTFEDLTAAMDEGAPFLAHRVIGMNPVDLIVNPANVATIERKI